MQYSIVNLQEIPMESTIFRLDSGFFHPKVLRTRTTIRSKTHSTLREIGAKIIHPSEIKREYEETGIQILLAQNIRDNFMDFSTRVYMPNNLEKNLQKNRLEYGDVVLTRSGANYGQCAPYLGVPLKIFACADDLVIRGLKILGTYLSTYLNTSFGKNLIESCKYGSSQPHISPHTLYDIPIYIPSDNLNSQIDIQLKSSFKFIKKSEAEYQQAQTLLLAELGLADWRPKHRLTFVKNYSDTEQAGRVDADYFRPKYEQIVNAIKDYPGGWDTLGNLCELVGHPSNPPYADTKGTNKTFIVTQKHLGDFSLNDEFWNDAEALYTTQDFIDKNNQYVLKTEDVLLYSVGAYIGKANIYKENIKATIGSFLTLLRTKKEKLNPYYLMVFLNTDIGVAISKQHQRGMAQQYLYPYDIKTFQIPLLPEEKQTQIQQKVTESFTLRKQSKHLLECAKRAVEIAIEQDEQTATQWLGAEANK